jgi:uncharacterized lipoprotein
LFAGDKKAASSKLKLLLQKGSKTTLTVQSEMGTPVDADMNRNLLNVLLDELR